jgi:hypothetical protein
MLNTNRAFFATLGIILSWLMPLVVFFLFLNVPPVRDLLTTFAAAVAVYGTVQLYRWGNVQKAKPAKPTPTHSPPRIYHAPTIGDTRTRIRQFLDTLTDSELDELQTQLQNRLNLRVFEEKNILEG